MLLSGWSKNNGGVHEVNMTPLIDVSLVLVVMLLLATPLAFESSIAVRNAKKTTQKAMKEKSEERIEVNILTEDSLTVNRQPVSRPRLSQVLRPLIEDNARGLVVIECSNGVSHGAFVEVLDQAKLCGASEIAISGE